MQSSEEIYPAELQRYTSELKEALESLCQSPAFRASAKSCEFLRHIVHYTLIGETAQLKERLIGIMLLGREATYDTGSDATVRVRANDVRKRLLAHYAAEHAEAGFTFDLPAGSYVPRFFRIVVRSPETDAAAEASDFSPAGRESGTSLSLRQMATPTLIALFLCTICLRWQIAQEHPFITFWQSVFQSHRVTLFLSPAGTSDGQDVVAIPELKAAAPLLNLAGQFHTQLTITSTPPSSLSASDVLVSIHSAAEGAQDSSGGGSAAARASLPGHSALLTIVNGARRSIRIDGTDNAAIGSLIEMLCERNTFPMSLTDSLQDGTITQVVFPMAPHAEAVVSHEMLPAQDSMVRKP